MYQKLLLVFFFLVVGLPCFFAQKQIKLDSLFGRYKYEYNIKMGYGCCTMEYIIELKENGSFSRRRHNNQGCYSQYYDSKGHYVISNDTITFISPITIADSLYLFRESGREDNLLKVTIKSNNLFRNVEDKKKCFSFYSLDEELNRTEINPRKSYTTLMIDEDTPAIHSNTSKDEISFFFEYNQISNFLIISEKIVKSLTLPTHFDTTYFPSKSFTVKTTDLSEKDNYIDLRDVETNTKIDLNIFFEDISGYRLLYRDNSLISLEKYPVYKIRELQIRRYTRSEK